MHLHFVILFSGYFCPFQVHGVNMSVSPLLKYKYQKCISCLSWRPLNASDLAIGCLNGIVIWSLDPTSVAVRPSASNVTFLQAPGHTPITSLAWDPRVLKNNEELETHLNCNVVRFKKLLKL